MKIKSYENKILSPNKMYNRIAFIHFIFSQSFERMYVPKKHTGEYI
jgi:hypothetical protein